MSDPALLVPVLISFCAVLFAWVLRHKDRLLCESGFKLLQIPWPWSSKRRREWYKDKAILITGCDSGLGYRWLNILNLVARRKIYVSQYKDYLLKLGHTLPLVGDGGDRDVSHLHLKRGGRRLGAAQRQRRQQDRRCSQLGCDCTRGGGACKNRGVYNLTEIKRWISFWSTAYQQHWIGSENFGEAWFRETLGSCQLCRTSGELIMHAWVDLCPPCLG